MQRMISLRYGLSLFEGKSTIGVLKVLSDRCACAAHLYRLRFGTFDRQQRRTLDAVLNPPGQQERDSKFMAHAKPHRE
jgi:hypothetical protein